MDESKEGDIRMSFVRGEQIDANELRPEILESWKRSIKTVDPFVTRNTNILSQEELKKLRQKYMELIEVTVPVMQNLLDLINNGMFAIFLSVVEGENVYVFGGNGRREGLAPKWVY